MASIEEAIAAAQLINSNANSLAQGSRQASAVLARNSQRIGAVSHPSRSGAEAARAVLNASKALEDCARVLAKLDPATRAFISDAMK